MIAISRTGRRRRAGGILGLLVALVIAGAAVPTAQARGVTQQQLAASGWTCFVPPTIPDVVVCFNPGLGRPFPGNPDPAPSYNFLAFSGVSGEFLFTGHLVRADLYRGQPCASSGDSYVFRALIGYYECLHV